MHAIFLDANETLAAVMSRLMKPNDIEVSVNINPSIVPSDIPGVAGDAEIIIIDHTYFPVEVAARCNQVKHVVFLGTGARSYMDPEALAERGISVHTIKGYGDTAVAECAIALMWTAAKGFARMDREMRAGNWLRTEGFQLTGKNTRTCRIRRDCG